MRKRFFAGLVVLALVAGGLVVAWHVFFWPPPRLVLSWGLPPRGAPTGREWTSVTGLRFVELSPGYRRVRRAIVADPGDWLGRICQPVGLPFGDHPQPSSWFTDRWVEIAAPLWITERSLSLPVAWAALARRGVEPGADPATALALLDGVPCRLATADEIRVAASAGALRCRADEAYWFRDRPLGEEGAWADHPLLAGPFWDTFAGSPADLAARLPTPDRLSRFHLVVETPLGE